MKVADRLNTLLKNPDVNTSRNDVTWASGWDRKIHTAQYRFGSAEAKDLAAEIGKLGPRTQKALVRELARRANVGGDNSFPAHLTFVSRAAANVMNDLAKNLGVDVEFKADSRRAPAPMG
ncbi:MAG: hypothetical protein HY791_29210 [Deltaproteobacteria bacterium]|nr:hypothetical protein [Deltaproteobacteria bacterium]